MPMTQPSSSPAKRVAYHHGALREALIEAAEGLLAERGLDGFSLREVARRSGVSPAAPAHHFGDANGLLVAVATQAFEGLAQALHAGDRRGGADPVDQLREQGLAYVGFALHHPGRFSLMFRCEGFEDEALTQAGRAAYGVLEDGIRRLHGLASGQRLTESQSLGVLGLWSLVHGFANLALSGQFDSQLPARGREAALRRLLGPLLDQQLRALRPDPVRR
ncbi:TetR/AcrR family transcriptional regulator [Pelomonas sp. SE-A7]|uniref:TetR/AcrR family transcriptional regulator n=1 Tax=Pelomonas sp. SE-A7 TaxID=3054953 RepID=UPI00259CCC3C|nr:TetR/AcrR family transcriptional regulator [Pelomonas sp. SE-A7]MDM4767086.1 TetR/AcrR family transcriptional regulator [Pelomonas sp. SE-A7]